MKICIRMDDITPDMDWTKFLRFKTLCDLYQVAPLIGVVPNNKDDNLHIEEPKEDFWSFLSELQAQGWVIAQHGYEHIYKTRKMGCFPLNRLSEFAGISYEKQYEELKEGKDILKAHGIVTDIFMAPAHSYDKNTLIALKALGFKRLTDGFGDTPYLWKGLIFYPISYKQSSSLSQKGDGCTTFVVHANAMNDRDFERYEKMFREYSGRFISYTDYLNVEPIKRSCAGHICEYLKAITKFILVSANGKLYSTPT